MNFIFLNLTALLLSMLSLLSFLLIIFKIRKPKYSTLLTLFIILPIIGIFHWYSVYFYNEIISYVVFLLLFLFLIKSFTHINWNQSIFAGIFISIHFICLKGIVVGALSLIFKKNLYQIVTVPNLSLISLIVTAIVQITAFAYYYKSLDKRKIECLLRSDKQIEDLLLQQSSLFVFMLFYSYNYYYNLDLVWFSFAQVILSFLIFILYFLILSYAINISYHLEKEIHTDILTQQLKLELAQHNAYQHTFTEIEEFKRHFREHIITLQYLIEEGDSKEINHFSNVEMAELLNMLPTRKEFSNNEHLNAILLDLDRQCNIKNIKFSACVFLSNVFEHKQGEILTLVHEIKEIYQHLTLTEGEISINGKIDNNRFIIQAIGTYNGRVYEKNNFPYFDVANGLNLSSSYNRLSDYIDANNGTLSFDADKLASLFTITVSIHT